MYKRQVEDPRVEEVEDPPAVEEVEDPVGQERPLSYSEQLALRKAERDELKRKDKEKVKETKAIERKRKRTMEYVRNCSVTDLVEAITEKTVTEHLLAVFSTCLCTYTIICS